MAEEVAQAQAQASVQEGIQMQITGEAGSMIAGDEAGDE